MATSLDTRPVFTATTLTGSYVTQSLATHSTADYIETKNVDQITLSGLYTTGSDGTGSSIQIKVEYANPLLGLPVAADWMQDITESITTGTVTESQGVRSFTGAVAGTAYSIMIPFPISAKFVRFSVKETKAGSVFGTVTLKATLRKQETFN